jgi:hypothetical protein
VSARYRKDEQALRQLGRAALRAHEDLQAEGYGAYRKLHNQATTTEGAKQ